MDAEYKIVQVRKESFVYELWQREVTSTKAIGWRYLGAHDSLHEAEGGIKKQLVWLYDKDGNFIEQ